VKSASIHLAIVSALAATGLSRHAVAQEAPRFGSKGDVVIEAAGLLGASSTATEIEITESVPGTGEVKTTRENSSTSWGFARPAVAVHGFVTDGLSLGAQLSFNGEGGTYEETRRGLGASSTEDGDLESSSNWNAAAVVGYAVPIGTSAAFWPRAKLGYGRGATENERSDAPGSVRVETSSGLGFVGAEAMFALTPFRHVAFLVGPFAATSLGG
jgi:hypothetical protein